LDGLTLRAVARRAGVSHAAPYHHFADRDALMAEVARGGFERLREKVASALGKAGQGHAAWEAAVGAYLDFALGEPSLYRVMFGTASTGRGADSALGRSAAAAFGLLLAGAAGPARVPGPGDVDRAVAAWSLLHGAASLAIDGQLPPAYRGSAGLRRVVTDAVVRVARPEG
jgi:AcrR family transcriptional regulator